MKGWKLAILQKSGKFPKVIERLHFGQSVRICPLSIPVSFETWVAFEIIITEFSRNTLLWTWTKTESDDEL